MTDLSNWEYTSIFSGVEAAALILGIDPSDPSADLSRTKPVVAGMMQWYNPVRYFPNHSPLSERPRNLASTLLKGHIARGDEEAFGRSEEANFEEQVFSAEELVRWLSANGMKSVYQFERSVTRAHGVAYESPAPEGGAQRSYSMALGQPSHRAIRAPRCGSAALLGGEL